ncbi:MAG: SDR family NAD(P)-dependent oxidoreductase [Saprospirales bacterium]|nr:SDR family NAD(P)-dependent oxidoreductase [Saprospirales bacterium]
MITSLFLKRMVESAPSRVIQVNSEGHRFNGLKVEDLTWANRPYRGLAAYGASKTAQLMTVWEFNDLLSGKGVTINAMHPGAVKSNIGQNNGKLYNLFPAFCSTLSQRPRDIRRSNLLPGLLYRYGRGVRQVF